MSFLVAADARSADARRSIAETLAFAPAVASIAAFEGELVALIDSLQAACEAAVEERLATAEVQGHISAAVSAAFDASRVEVGAEALAAIDGGTDWDATLADQRLERFAVSFGQLPDGVSQLADVNRTVAVQVAQVENNLQIVLTQRLSLIHAGRSLREMKR